MSFKAFEVKPPLLANNPTLAQLEIELLKHLKEEGFMLDESNGLDDTARLSFVPDGNTEFLVYLIQDGKLYKTDIWVTPA